MIVELAQDIFSKEGLVALVLIIVLVILVIMAVTLYKLVSRKDKDDDTVSIQAEVIAQLVAPIKEIANSLKSVSEANAIVSQNLLDVARLLKEHDSRVASMRLTLDAAIERMGRTVIEQDRQIDELPGKVKNEMTPDLEKIPKAVEEALAPKIEALQQDIKTLIQALDDKLSERIEAAADQIPNRTTELIRAELAKMSRTVEASLKDMLETAKSISFPKDEPGEAELPQPEHNEAHKENG